MKSVAQHTISCPEECESPQNINIWDRLKRATAHQHEQLELRLDLLRPTFTMEEYACLLSRFYGFYQPWEERAWPLLRRHAPSLVPGRQKLPLLMEDLRFLGKTPESLSVTESLPPLTTAAQTLGSCYVLEGATLGGQVLFRHFARRLGLGPQGLSFFRGYGENTGTMWHDFRQVLLTKIMPAQEDALIGSAVATFAALAAWLEKGEA